MDTSSQEEEDILSCSICLQIMKEPKVLPCLHRLCESCLSDHITASTATDSAKPTGFLCPECRQFTIPVNIDSPPTTWATQFKTDFLIKGMTELHASRQELHKNNNQYTSHPCPEHTNTEVDLYCVDCSKTVCHLCAATRHEKCDRLVAVEKAAQDHRPLVQEKINGIQPIIDGALEREQVRELYMRELNTKVMLADKDIREFTEKAHTLVNEQKEHLLNELHKNYEDLQQNISLDVFKLTDDVKKLQDNVKMGKLKLANTSDLDLFLDASFNAAIDSCSKQTIGLKQHYDSLCKQISHVECRFEASKSPCVSLGNILFASDFKGSDHPKPSNSQSSTFTPRLMSSQASGVNFESMPPLSGLAASTFSPGSMPSPSGLQASTSSLEPMPSPPRLPPSKSSLGSMPSLPGLQESTFSPGSMPSPSGIQASTSSLEPMPSPPRLPPSKSSLGSMPSLPGLQESTFSPGSMPSPSGLQASTSSLGPMPSPPRLPPSKSSLGSMPSPPGLQESKSFLGSMQSPSGLQESKSSLGSMSSQSSISASAFSLGSMSSQSSISASAFSLGSMSSQSSISASAFSLGPMSSQSSISASTFSLGPMSSQSSISASTFSLGPMSSQSSISASTFSLGPMSSQSSISASAFSLGPKPSPSGSQSSNVTIIPRPPTAGQEASIPNEDPMSSNQIPSVISRVRKFSEAFPECIDDEIEKKKRKT